MTNAVPDKIRDAFQFQIGFCRKAGSELTAQVLDGLLKTLDYKTRTGARILDWPGDPIADVIMLRIAGGLHGLARSGADTDLSALYAGQRRDFDEVLARVIKTYDDWLYPWLDSPPQTNEVGRSGALMPGLMVAAGRLGLPIELIEIGGSAGLNINLDRFRYGLGGVSFGPEGSAVRIAPEWDGPPPSGQWPEIVARRCNDQLPIDVRDDAVVARLLAYCWADQTERLQRLEAAIAVARAHPVAVEAGDAAEWIEGVLANPQPEGHMRIVMHSVFWQYLPAETRIRIENAIRAAGVNASEERPLGWLRFEPDPPAVGPMQVRLDLWPAGECLHLGVSHPHGTQIKWFGYEV
jgi:hypothetical protein